ncbi:MAG TPA: enoyl-ACP reductase [Devosia sp.]|nr:enoyl-ACP reductase [Devosia sp.]
MAGKRGLIMGVANKRSIAFGIASALRDAGAQIALSYQGEVLQRRVAPLAEELGCNLMVECDVTDDGAIDKTFETLKEKWGRLDFLVHAIGFSNKEELEGRYVDTSAENFALTMNVSVYSFTAVARRAQALMAEGGSMLTLTYNGSQKVVPNYNVMGVAKAALESSVRYLAADLGPQKIRVNSISAGAIKTLAAAGISDFRSMLAYQEATAPLRRNITAREVGNAALYLLSDLSSGVTGENHYVDGGYNIMGMSVLDSSE